MPGPASPDPGPQRQASMCWPSQGKAALSMAWPCHCVASCRYLLGNHTLRCRACSSSGSKRSPSLRLRKEGKPLRLILFPLHTICKHSPCSAGDTATERRLRVPLLTNRDSHHKAFGFTGWQPPNICKGGCPCQCLQAMTEASRCEHSQLVSDDKGTQFPLAPQAINAI